MTDQLDRRIRQLLGEIDDAAPAPHPWSHVTMTSPTTPVRWLVPVIALSAVVAAAVVAVLVVPDRDPSRVVTVPSVTVSSVPEVTTSDVATSVPAVPPPTAAPPSGPRPGAGLQLSPEVAAELAAAGNTDALALLARLPVEATIMLGVCDDGGCATYRATDPQAPPEAVPLAGPLTYVDVPAVLTVAGVDPETTRERPLDEWFPDDQDVRSLLLPQFFLGDLPDEERAEVGFTTADIDRMAQIRNPPDLTAVLDVAVPLADIDAAVHADPAWSPDLRVVDDAGTSYYDWNRDLVPFSQDLLRATPMRPLGVGGQLLATADGDGDGDGAHVTRTHDPAVMQAAVAGTGRSILTDGPYAPALALLPQGRLVQLQGWGGQMRPEPETADADADADADEPYVTGVLALSVDADGLRTDSYYVFADDATAAANVDRIANAARNGRPADAATGAPAYPGQPDAQTDLVGRVVHVAVPGVSSGVALQITG